MFGSFKVRPTSLLISTIFPPFFKKKKRYKYSNFPTHTFLQLGSKTFVYLEKNNFMAGLVVTFREHLQHFLDYLQLTPVKVDYKFSD